MKTWEAVTAIFREEFQNDTLVVNETTNADDIADWDSLANINLVVAMEREFGIKIDIDDYQKIQNVGDMVKLIEKLRHS